MRVNRALPKLFILVPAGLLLLLPVSQAPAADQTYTNWPKTDEWNDLTNHLWQVYQGIVLRSEIVGEAPGVNPPDYVYPFNDYQRFAKRIDQLCTSFVCQVRAGDDETFDEFFATLDSQSNYPGYFPMWSVSNLHAEAGFDDWATNVALHSWSITDRHIQQQVQSALNLLVWTADKRPARYDYLGHKSSPIDQGTWIEGWYEGDDPYAESMQEAYAEQQSAWEQDNWTIRDQSFEGGYGIWAKYVKQPLVEWQTVEFSGSPVAGRNGIYTNTGTLISKWPSFSNGTNTLFVSDNSYHTENCRHWVCAGATGSVESISTTCGPAFSAMAGLWRTLSDAEDGSVAVLSASTNDTHRFYGFRWTARQEIDNIATSISHSAQAYQLFGGIEVNSGLSPFGPRDSFVVVSNRYTLLQDFSEATVTQRVGTAMSRFGNPELENNPVTMMWTNVPTELDITNAVLKTVGVSSGAHNHLGWFDSRRTRWLLKWDGAYGLVPIQSPSHTNLVLLADINQDEIAITDMPFDAPGADYGTIIFRPEEASATAGILLTRTPVWFAGAPIYCWLADIGLRHLPYHYLVPGESDEDGAWQAMTLNTRILETGLSMSNTVKKVSLLRPSGRLVVFDFAYDNGAFSDKGYPAGINSNRTYTLRDLTPADHADDQYELLFDSGFVHEFNKLLVAVRGPDGLQTAIIDGVFPGGFVQAGGWYYQGRYRVDTYKHEGKVNAVTYTPHGSTSTVVSAISYHPDGHIKGFAKSGMPDIEDSDVALSEDGESIQHAWGTVTRSATGEPGQAREVTITQTYDEHGASSRIYAWSARDLLTKMTVERGPHSADTIYNYYDNRTGRYVNGRPKWSLRKSVQMPDQSMAWFAYTDQEGWLHQKTTDYTETLQLVETHDYALHEGPLAGLPADPTSYTAQPRTITSRIDGTVIRKTLNRFYADGEQATRKCARADAEWYDPDNMELGVKHVQSGLFVGRPELLETDDNVIRHSYTSENNDLITITTDGNQQELRLVVNAYGTTYVHEQRNEGKLAVETISVCDDFGRVLKTDFLKRSSVSNTHYTLHGPRFEYGIDQTPKEITYFKNGWVKSIRHDSVHSLSELRYDALGNNSYRRDTIHGKVHETSAEFDAIGQELRFSAPIGTRIVRREADGKARRMILDYPQGAGDQIISMYPDGRRKSSSGSGASRIQEYEYGVENDLRFIKHIQVNGGSRAQWVKTWYNMLNLPVKQQQSSSPSGKLLHYNYNLNWQLASRIDEQGVTYAQTVGTNAKLKRVGIDADGDGELDGDSQDRLVEYAERVDEEGVTAEAHTMPQKFSSVLKKIGSIFTSHDGRVISETGGGKTNHVAVSEISPGGRYFVTNTLNQLKMVAEYDKWRLKEVKALDRNGKVINKESYEYHPHGQLKKVIRKTGVTDIVVDAMSRIAEVHGENKSRPPIKLTYHDNSFLVNEVTWTNGKKSRYDYYPNGLVKQVDDGTDGLYAYAYDDQSRMLSMTTQRDGKMVATYWTYYPDSGLLASKTRPGQTNPERYEYYANGQLAAIISPDQVRKDFVYGPAGDLYATTTSPGDRMNYQAVDRLGRVIYNLDAQVAGVHRTFNDLGRVAQEMHISMLPVPTASIAVNYAAHAPLPELKSFTIIGQTNIQVATDYDDADRVTLAGLGPVQVHYLYETNANAVSRATIMVNNQEVLRHDYGWNGRELSSITSLRGATPVATSSLVRAPDSDQVEQVHAHDGTYWQYEFDEHFQVTQAERLTPEGLVIPGYSFAYEYDEAGNIISGGRAYGSVQLRDYENNDMNLQLLRSWEDSVEVTGKADKDALVSVNGITADRIGEWFRVRLPTGHRPAAQRVHFTAMAVLPGQAEDQYDFIEGNVTVPASDSAVGRRTSGAVLSDSRHAYTWDANDRLASVESMNPQNRFLVEYNYLPDGRRFQKKLYDWSENSSEYQLKTISGYYYDEWNMVAEVIQDHSLTHDEWNPDSRRIRQYLWGMDAAGMRTGTIESKQLAGGAGGLIAIIEGENVLLPVSDHVGTIRSLVDAASGNVVADYDYSPFGELIAESGPEKDSCPFRFNSKYEDRESGLLYYGLRHYDPATCKWLSDDPLQEDGGPNLSQFAYNDPINIIDPFGEVGFFFDGTWNYSNQVTQYKGKYYNRETLVSRLSVLYDSGEIFYQRGIGNEFDNGKLMVGIGGIFGLGGRTIIRDMYKDLYEHYNSSTDRHIDIFGFSRGSAQAIEFANIIKTKGIPDTSIEKRRMRYGPKRRGLPRHSKMDWPKYYKNPPIRFIGVLDLVGSFGWPKNILFFIPTQQLNFGYRLRVPDNVQHVYHAMALDERRDTFDVTRLHNAHEVWFRGIHGTIGGSEHDFDRRLPDIVANWMIKQANKSGVRFNDYGAEFGEIAPDGPGKMTEQTFRSFPFRIPFRPIRRKVLPGDRVHRSVDRSLYPHMPPNVEIAGN